MTNRVSRREFVGQTLAGLGLSGIGPALQAADASAPRLPTVRWGNHDLTRLLVGHNPIKGISHQTSALSDEMRRYFADDAQRGVELLRRCEEVGLNACQMGYRPSEPFVRDMLQRHHEAGGQLKWIATFYSSPQDPKEAREELDRLLRLNPRPIGVQQVGNTSDELMRTNRLKLTQENLKRFRDSGLLVGLGTHNHEVIDHAESQGWDLDFYQCSFYRSLFSLAESGRGRELFEEEARESMTRTIRQATKPCIAFKVLGAGRHCESLESIEAALRCAFDHIKPSDVVLLGMWQKHRNQVGENARLVRKILAPA
jgi:hypothetical protein